MTPSQTLDPASAESPATDLGYLLNTVAVAHLADSGWIEITGEDRVRWLNGMVTNSIQQLTPGQGNYNFALNAQGQIQGDLTAFATPNSLLLETSLAQVPTLLAHFDRFIIMDDVELRDLSPTRAGLLVAGPRAPELLTKLNLTPNSPISLQSTPSIDLIAAHSPRVPRFELWTEPATLPTLQTDVLALAQTLDGGPATPEALEHLRLLEATPRFGTDILKHLPQETAQTHALHFAKGCYLGQEIVERIRSRGNVHRTIASFRLEGCLPAPGTPLTADGKPIGELTSISGNLALGTIRRETLDRSTPILYGDATAIPIR